MKSAILSALYVLIAISPLRAESPPAKYKRTANVEDLGTIAFPTGEWILEFRRVQPPGADVKLRDYFTFKRVNGDLERMTIFRYKPGYPWPLVNMLDGIGETMGNGIPPEEEPHKAGQEIHPLMLEPRVPNSKDKYLNFTFISVQEPPSRCWLCHAYLFLREGYAFVLTHSSQSVINPNTIDDVGIHSRFLTAALKPPPRTVEERTAEAKAALERTLEMWKEDDGWNRPYRRFPRHPQPFEPEKK
jgi:hypothetical protein